MNTLLSPAPSSETALQQSTTGALCIRPFRADDLTAVMACHPQKMTEENLRWALKGNPYAPLFVLAEKDGEILGYSIHLAMKLSIAGQIAVGYRGSLYLREKSTHHSAHPLLFSRLMNSVIAQIRQEKAVFFGFPIPRLVHYYTRKHGTCPVGKIPRYLAVLRLPDFLESKNSFWRMLRPLTHIVGTLLKPRISLNKRNITTRSVSRFDSRSDELWQRACRHYGVIAQRDAEYLNWRYFEKPQQRFVVVIAEENEKLLGYVVLKVAEHGALKIGIILDLLDLGNRNVSKSLLRQALCYFREQGADLCEAFLANPFTEKQLRSAGFFRWSNRSRDSDILFATHYGSDVDERSLLSLDNWLITKADMSGI